ncbi:hypothetical protein [Methylibium sp.]|uniref:hypothetical protein n=1 Tax=Methylibium sp. TaxID=2067992 RepID=UPI003D0B7C06
MPAVHGSCALNGVTGCDLCDLPTGLLLDAGGLRTSAGTAAGAGAWKAVCHQRFKGFHKIMTMVNLQTEVQQD